MNKFQFKDCIELKELLGVKADDCSKLLELIEEVPADSIYYHTHSYFLRHYYISGPYTNDFANWAAIQLRDRVLGEKLAVITPWEGKDIEDIRTELIDTIDDYLYNIKSNPFITAGQPFYFMKSKIIEVDTKTEVGNLREFRDALKIIDASAIYNHIFEARIRIKKGKSDFYFWLERELGKKDLADKIERLDSYMHSLEGLRGELINLCNQELGE